MYFEVTYLNLKTKKKEKKVIEANDIADAASKFKALKIGVFTKAIKIDEPFEIKLEKLKKKLIKKFEPTQIDLEEYIAILEQIYVMLDASLSINDILDNVTEHIKNKKLKEIFTALNQDIKSGMNISTSLKKYEKSIGKLSIAMIELGEQSGLLAESFKELAEILSEILENRKKLKSATRYPIFIVFAMSVAFTIVILFVIPPFKSVFAQLGSNLPLPTRFLLWLENFIRTFGPPILTFSILSISIINYLYAINEKVRLLLDKIILKIYIVGDVIENAMLGRFLFAFEKMVNAGIPIMDALDTALGIVENSYLKQQLFKIKLSIAEGKGLSNGFAETKLFEKMVIQMIRSGENSGSLNRMLEKTSLHYKRKYTEIVDNIATLIEPILIAAIAGFVATLAFGIFLPMWGMADAVNGAK